VCAEAGGPVCLWWQTCTGRISPKAENAGTRLISLLVTAVRPPNSVRKITLQFSSRVSLLPVAWSMAFRHSTVGWAKPKAPPDMVGGAHGDDANVTRWGSGWNMPSDIFEREYVGVRLRLSSVCGKTRLSLLMGVRVMAGCQWA